ncbi:MAG: choice-of-anchor J domain-containing protein, partial [Cyclobacteriaceae bacterium]|nr:choice-of-anchor J domain-containing protein [Cyclobacteriaceae bacterium]
MVRTLPIFFAAIALFAFLSPNVSYAQERCGIVEYEKQRNANKKNPETEQAFEQWMQQKLSEGRLKTFQTGKTQSFSGTIPVVVHVIHNGEPVGTGTNVSDAQILSQIQVLNEDYKRLNADANQTPAEFGSVAGSIDLQFVLAKQDPEGLPTNGIVRVRGTQSSWDALSENNIFKALSYWPAEDYLNIWVLNLTGSFIGYAQLPISTLAGLEGSSTDRLTDGVSVDYQAFGSGSSFNLLPQYNKGRTATHEIGHFFGLRHIWGDGNCATDYVDDTPFQTSSTNGCPSHPQASCDAPAKPNKMFQNYLDDTNDVCMNLFTQGQVARMIVVLQNSIRRISLLNSPGATAPVVVTNDLGIRQIVSPSSTLCNTSITPRIEVRNYGSNTVTSSQIQLTVNGVVAEARTFSGLSLAPEASTTVSFNDVTITSSNPVFAFQILQTNGLVDGKPSNNSASITVTIIPSSSLPIIEPFNATPPGWQIINPDGNITWANVVAPDNSVTNRAMYMNFHAYENEGTLDWLITPAFPLVNPSGSQLKFDLAYAQFPGEAGDGLKVYALRGCNTDLSQAILLYDKTSTALATAASTSNSFVPSSESQWRKSEVISLDGLTGATNWQLAFVARNGYGNNLFIDNAIVSDQVINDLALTSILQPGLVHCVQNPVI